MRLSSRRGKSSADEARSVAAASVGDTPIVRFRRNGVDSDREPRGRYLVHTGLCQCLCDRAEDAPKETFAARMQE
jgi:hypothetical protein